MTARETLALAFLQHADSFRIAAERLNRSKPFPYHPTFYAVLHSIELGLKSHLALGGISKTSLASRALGHNLGALVALASEIGATAFLDSHARRAITYGGKDYSKKCFEYPELMASSLSIGRWLAIAKNMIASTKATLKQ